MSADVRVGDCRAVMAQLAPASVDAVVCDPPYHLTQASRGGSPRVPGTGPFGRHRLGERGFMGKTWDGGGVAFHPRVWRRAFRVAKPGAYLVAFGGPRTWHRLACAVEDAGWEIHDSLCWLFGSGFPKHASKLKPAHEPIILARKPAALATALNVDACRIGTEEVESSGAISRRWRDAEGRTDLQPAKPSVSVGRWPANVVLDETAAELLDEQSGELVSGANPTRREPDKFRGVYEPFAGQRECAAARGADIGGASRFYYVAKASRAEREAGLYAEHGHEKRPGGSLDTHPGGIVGKEGRDVMRRNHHPTVKPLDLMRWLVRLVTPPGGLVLDPFAGSGSTGCAAVLEGRRFVGVEQSPEYAEIARARIAHWARQHEPSLFGEAAS